MFTKKGSPLYSQLKDILLKDIKENYKAGEIIPAEPKLEEIYKVSRIPQNRENKKENSFFFLKNTCQMHEGVIE